jgi:hypothetical protein
LQNFPPRGGAFDTRDCPHGGEIDTRIEQNVKSPGYARPPSPGAKH